MCQAIVRHLDDEAILTRRDGDRATPRPISASVLSAERDERSNSLVFLVKVSEHGDGYISYFLQRKHDSFAAMHAGLMAQPSLASRTPPLPPKPRRYSKLLDAWSHVDRLSEYLTLVVRDSELLGSQDVRGFLELSAADQLASKLREREEMFLQLVTEKDRAIEEQQRLLCSLQAATNIAGQREHLRSLHPETMTTLQAVVYDHEKCGSGNDSWWVYKIRVEFSSAGRPVISAETCMAVDHETTPELPAAMRCVYPCFNESTSCCSLRCACAPRRSLRQ
mmetsp:Transcript_35039/g.85155  ORF Transcript_35039/g.85155 Transcript_35039/m.85155 type:complete len:279 (+) Transcript_35039:128-964(+)